MVNVLKVVRCPVLNTSHHKEQSCLSNAESYECFVLSHDHQRLTERIFLTITEYWAPPPSIFWLKLYVFLLKSFIQFLQNSLLNNAYILSRLQKSRLLLEHLHRKSIDNSVELGQKWALWICTWVSPFLQWISSTLTSKCGYNWRQIKFLVQLLLNEMSTFSSCFYGTIDIKILLWGH